jgi:hypothetical protein
VVQIDAEIIGALVGAIVGAFAAAEVSRRSIRYDHRITACSAMQALADEARFNAHVVRHMGEDLSDYSPSAAERQAFDEALPVLHVLPPDLRDRARDARSQILIMMHIDEILEKYLTKPGAPPAAIVQKRQGLIEMLPNELDSLADAIETFVKTDCEARWFRPRSASRHELRRAVKRFPVNRDLHVDQIASRSIQIGRHPQPRRCRQGNEPVRIRDDVVARHLPGERFQFHRVLADRPRRVPGVRL